MIAHLLYLLQAVLVGAKCFSEAWLRIQGHDMYTKTGTYVQKSELHGQGLFIDVLNSCLPCERYKIVGVLGYASDSLMQGMIYNHYGTTILWKTSDQCEAGFANTAYKGDVDKDNNPIEVNAVFRGLNYKRPNGDIDVIVVLISTREIPWCGEVIAEYDTDVKDESYTRAQVGLPPLY